MSDKFLAILFSLMILGQAWVVRRHVGSWAFPACLFGLFWFAYTFIPLVVMYWVPVNPLAIGFILVCCGAFSATAFLFDWRRAYALNDARPDRVDYGTPFIRRSFYGLSIATIVLMLIDTTLQGYTLYNLVFNLMEVSGEFIARRYSEDLDSNLFGRLSVVLTYPSATLGGIVYASRQPGTRGVGIIALALIPSVLVMLVQGAKGTLFLVLALFWAGILICKINTGDKRLIRRESARQLILYGLILLPVVIMSFLARGLGASDDADVVTTGLLRYLASYAFAHLYAFSDWFSAITTHNSIMAYQDYRNTGGFYTLTALFRIFGDARELPAGVYDEYFYHGDILQSNIYTLFRGLINDFGLAGAPVVMMAAGVLNHALFARQLAAAVPTFSASFFAHAIGFYYTSFIISLLIWNSIYASFLIVSALLWVNAVLQRRIDLAPRVAGPPAATTA